MASSFASSCNKANRALLYEEVRFLIFDRMTENQQSQRPQPDLAAKSYGHITGYTAPTKFSTDFYREIHM
jgi:hypothetical protein